MNLTQAKAITGGLSNPSKMPGKAYSIPAQACRVGARLVNVPNSVCNGCYALKGMYRFPTVRNALQRRLDSLDHPDWVDAMVLLVKSAGDPFRWHDSGDIQSIAHLERICEVARRTPEIRHWLPTREYKLAMQYKAGGGDVPDNLVIRLSAHMVDGAPPEFGLPTSTVVTTGATCPASSQNNECRDCRACWNPTVQNVAYAKH
jgi:hypothetical protein